MSESEKKKLVTEIQGRIDEFVSDLFIDYHNVYQIESGDIDVLDCIEMGNREESLAQIIVNVLNYQI